MIFRQVISLRAADRRKRIGLFERRLSKRAIFSLAYDHDWRSAINCSGRHAEARSNAAVAIRAINTAEAVVASARTQVGNARAAVATAETQVDQARKGVADNVIYSPISGYVSERNADPGEYISPNQPNAKLATIVRTAVLRLQIDIPEQSIGKVAVGQGVSAQVSAYPTGICRNGRQNSAEH